MYTICTKTYINLSYRIKNIRKISVHFVEHASYIIMNQLLFKQEMSLKKTNGVRLKKEENITQG